MNGEKLAILTLVGCFLLPGIAGAQASVRVYEDAEDGSAERWTVYDDTPEGASVSITSDSELSSQVIELSGDGTANGFRLGGTTASSGGWNDADRFFVSWRMRTDEPFAIYVTASTARGSRYFHYNHSGVDRGRNGKYLRFGLGSSSRDGTWSQISRDLTADLEASEPGNTLEAVHGFLVRGSLRLDDITLSADAPQVSNAPPKARAGKDRSALVGQPLSLNGSNSVDSDGEIVQYEWTLDGEPIGSTAKTDWLPLQAGTNIVSLTVTDDAGATDSDSLVVDVSEPFVADTDPEIAGYELVFSDEFDGSELDSSKWYTGLLWGPYYPINNEQQMYVDTLGMHAGFQHSPFEMTGETLKITATPTSESLQPPPRPPENSEVWQRKHSRYRYNGPSTDPNTGSTDPGYQPSDVDYLSGIITSYDSFKMTHGYVEARVKLPAGRGLWPAFWMLPTHYVENVPEIDVMEFLGQDTDRIYNTYHFFDIPSGWELVSSPSFPVYASDWTTGFHTFGMDWSPNKITWYVDGVEAHSITSQDTHSSGRNYKIPTQAMYLIANLAVGGNWPGAPDASTVFPATYEIDYIRAYKKETADPIDLSRDYQMVFRDEFDGTSLDPEKWSSHFIWGPYLPINGEDQYYVDSLQTDSDIGYSPFRLVNGTLQIVAREWDDPNGVEPPDLPPLNDSIWTNNPNFRRNTEYVRQDFTSGVLTSYDSFRFAQGYAEIRARVPKGDGLWPAFWLLNAYYVGQQPEIDVLEVRGRRPDQIVHNYHRYEDGGVLRSDEFISTRGTPELGYADRFHRYGVRWRPGRIDWYIDGVPVHSYVAEDVPYQLMYVILNLAVGGAFDPGATPNPDDFPARFVIDYVRVYQEKDR